MSRESVKGQRFERLVADYLRDRLGDPAIDIRPKNGRFDRGDVGGVKTIRGSRVCIEVKNHSRDNLPLWMREVEIEKGNDDAPIGVVVHKRHRSGKPEDQYVTCDLATFALLLEGGPDDRPVIILDPMTRGAA